MEYNARFIRSPLGVVPDREYNVAAIADAAMGEGSVLDCAADSPDVLSATLRPRAAGGNAFVVNARVLFRDLQTGPAPARVGEDESDALADMLWSEGGREGEALYASEMIRQTVTLDNGDLRARPLVKDVETTTVVFEPDGGGFNALQRTATFLTRDDLRYVDAKGAPVDVRVYVLRYTRQQ